VELVEIKANLSGRRLPTVNTPHEVLCNIYNHNCITGSLFINEAYTKVSYHTKNPSCNDEFKLRLPDVLTSRHWLKFTAYHVHVKLQGGRNSILSSIMRSSIDKLEHDSTVIGVGFLPLMYDGDALIPDEEHVVILLPPDVDLNKSYLEHREDNTSKAVFSVLQGAPYLNDIPLLRVRTRSLCSLVSVDKRIQALFKNNPISLGYLPSSIMPLDVAARICYKSCSLELKEDRLTTALKDVMSASTMELTRHFLVNFRIVVRALLGGTCCYDENYINPYKHAPVRAQAFIALMTLFDKVFGDMGNSTGSSESSKEREVLDVCIDHLFDEEIPVPAAMISDIVSGYLTDSKTASKNSTSDDVTEIEADRTESHIQPFSPDHLNRLLQKKESRLSECEHLEQDFNQIKADSPEKLFQDENNDINDNDEKVVNANEYSTANEIAAHLDQAMDDIIVHVDEIDMQDVPVAVLTPSASEDVLDVAARLSPENSEYVTTQSSATAEEQVHDNGNTIENVVDTISSETSVLSPNKDIQEQEPNSLDTLTPAGVVSSSVESSPDKSENKPLDDNTTNVEGNEFSMNDGDGDEVYAEEEVIVKPGHESLERRSWGAYITESLWNSGRLSASISSLRRASTAQNEELAEKIIDDIAQHIVLQVSRIMEERLINVGVETITQVIIYNSEQQESETSTNNHVMNDYINLNDYYVLAGRRYRISGSFEDTGLSVPFEVEKAWFRAIDEGRIIDEQDVSVNGDVNKEKLMKRLSAVRKPEIESMQLGSIEPIYDRLDGYCDRVDNLLAPDPHFAILKHWWPYIYEIITCQWITILYTAAPNLYTKSDYIATAYPIELTPENVKDLRNQVIEYGPILLKMIHKSLALRIHREGKRSPVLLDDQYFVILENLVSILAVECVTVATGVWRSRRMVQALARFINSLFALIAPKQVLRLIRSYFKSLRNSKAGVEETEQRLIFLLEITYFDHAVAVNFPYTLDAPLSLFFANVDDIDHPPDDYVAISYTFTGIRFNHCPTPYTLAYTIITEIMNCYRLDSNKRQSALETMRDLLVRHAYDSRYQRKGKQQRIACMYIPLINEFMKELDRLWSLKFDSVERREMLTMFMYVINGIPERLLRHLVRHLCDSSTLVNNTRRSTRYSRSNTVDYSMSPTCGSPMRVLSLKRDSLLATPDVEAFVPSSIISGLPIYMLMKILHLALDTFEISKSTPMAAPGKEDLSQIIDMLSPVVEIDSNTSDGALDNVTSRRGSGQGVESRASQLLANLDNRLQRKAAGTSRRNLSSSGRGDERRWAEHARKMAADAPKGKRVGIKPVSRNMLESAAVNLSTIISRTVLNTLWVMIEECPQVLDTQDVYEVFGVTGSFILRDCNIEEAMFAGISNLRIVPFLRMSLCILLHGLYCNQDPEIVQELFISTISAVRKFGAKLFLLAAEDSLQFWLRSALFFCGYPDSRVRGSASDFILCMLRSAYHYFGSFTLISTTILAVFGDSLSEILDSNRLFIRTVSDEDKILAVFSDSIHNMCEAAKAKMNETDTFGLPYCVSFCSSLISLMKDLDTLMVAHAYLRKYVTHPVGYDFYGGNLLDGPFDSRTTALVQANRLCRKAVSADPGDKGSAVKAGFHIEEVMVQFVAASQIYDAYKLPRFRMLWLENLARLHELCSNRAEGAEIRWRIFCIGYQLQDSWNKLWSPRPPLPWLRRGRSPTTSDSSLIYNSIEGGIPPGGSPTHGMKAMDTERNFFKVLMRALDAKCMHPWMDVQQYSTHMVTALTVATERFCSTNLVHLAERASGHLINLYRLARKTEMMMGEYNRIATALKKGYSASLALGTFYRVYYEGQGK
jgi:hypothetical protein